MTKQRKLTAKQSSYTNNRIKGMNPSEAYRKSKYSSSKMSPHSIQVEANRLENHPVISPMIDAARIKAESDAIMTRDEALRQLTTHARVKLTDVFDFRLEEVEVAGLKVMRTVWEIKPLADIASEVAACIKSISFDSSGKPKIETYDSGKAIQQLRAMQGWDAAKEFDHRSSDGSMSPTEKLSDEQVEKIMKERGLSVAFDT